MEPRYKFLRQMFMHLCVLCKMLQTIQLQDPLNSFDGAGSFHVQEQRFYCMSGPCFTCNNPAHAACQTLCCIVSFPIIRYRVRGVRVFVVDRCIDHERESLL